MKNIKFVILAIINIIGLAMMVSEGSAYFWANLTGVAMFGASAYGLGLFRGPYNAD